MGKFPLIIGFVLLLAACDGTGPPANNSNENISFLNPELREPPGTNEELNEKLGYVSHTNENMERSSPENINSINRNQLADILTHRILQNDGFEEVATLITDREVFIVFRNNEAIDKERAAEIAERSALSTMPSYYVTYVSGNPALLDDIQKVNNAGTIGDYDTVINHLKNNMREFILDIDSNEEINSFKNHHLNPFKEEVI